MSKPSRDLAMILAGVPAKPAPNYAAIPMSLMQPGGEPMPPPPPQMPPSMNLGPLPPQNADAQQYDDAARARPMPMQPAPQAAAPMPQMPPVQVQAPAMDPRTMGDADLGGYGGNMGQGAPMPAPAQYGHLNPTPSLEEVFRREYAANPAAFGKLFG
jgi:hypothetical protein